MSRSGIGGCVLAVACLGAAASARAQTLDLPTPRPIDAPNGRTKPGSSQEIDLDISTAAAYDSDLGTDEVTPFVDPASRTSGAFGSLTGTLTYRKRFRHGAFGLSESSNGRYYTGSSPIAGMQHVAGAGLSLQFARSQLTMGESVGLLPFYTFSTLPTLFAPGLGEVAAASPEQALAHREERFATSLAMWQQTFGRRARLTLSSDYQQVTFHHESTGLQSTNLYGKWSEGLTSSLSLVAGYGLHEWTYRPPAGDRQTMRNHDVDLGVTFDRPLSVSRRTTVSMNVGSALFQDVTRVLQYHLTGEARLNREIGRSWHATAAYRRGVQYVAGFERPLYADGLNVETAGRLTRSAQVSASGGYSVGDMIGLGPPTHTWSYTGSAQLRIALSQRVAVTAAYLLYRYRFDQPSDAPAGLPYRLDRQALRFGIDVWYPLLRD